MTPTETLAMLADAATPGPWIKSTRGCDAMISTEALGFLFPALGNSEGAHQDAEFIAAANPSAIKSLLARIESLEKDSARLDALEKLVNFGVWQGSWAEHMGEKAGKPIVDINEMCDDGQEIVRHISRGETLREAIDAILGGENNSVSYGAERH